MVSLQAVLMAVAAGAVFGCAFGLALTLVLFAFQGTGGERADSLVWTTIGATVIGAGAGVLVYVVTRLVRLFKANAR